jgi:hypothetical protein
MKYICTSLEEINGVQVCTSWIEYYSVFDELKITHANALMLLAAIASLYVILIAWSFIVLLFKRA